MSLTQDAFTVHITDLSPPEMDRARNELTTLLIMARMDNLLLDFKLIENASDYMRPQVNKLREFIAKIARLTCDHCTRIEVSVEIVIEGLSYTSSGPIGF